jgi:hypothetical protein
MKMPRTIDLLREEAAQLQQRFSAVMDYAGVREGGHLDRIISRKFEEIHDLIGRVGSSSRVASEDSSDLVVTDPLRPVNEWRTVFGENAGLTGGMLKIASILPRVISKEKLASLVESEVSNSGGLVDDEGEVYVPDPNFVSDGTEYGIYDKDTGECLSHYTYLDPGEAEFDRGKIYNPNSSEVRIYQDDRNPSRS